MNKQRILRRSQAILAAAALAMTLGGVGYSAVNHFWPALQLKLANPAEGASRTGFSPVVKQVVPAVVNISSSRVSKVPAQFFQQMPDDPIFRQFFGDESGRRFSPRRAPEQREQSLGSGVLMSPDGYILTNNHVVDGATEVRVTLSDKREFKAKVVGKDPQSDIAVLKVDAAGLPSITVGDSSKVQVGDYALAVGDPFGVGQTVTMGIVSATGRSHLGIEDYEDFIQTDAPINPGNSGGALVNDRGELIGVNTAILAHGSEGNQGIGFAIPVNQARSVMEQIVRHGKVTRAYLGIVPQDVTPAIANAFGYKNGGGALVGDVSAGSPAQKSGIERGDIIREVDGKPVTDANNLRMTISMMAPGTETALKVVRKGAERDVKVKLDELPTEQAAVRHDNSSAQDSALSGVSVENLDADAAHDLNLPPHTQGVVVTEVAPSSEAARAGLRRGDVIQEVNRQPIRSTADFERALRASKEEPLLLVNRNGNTLYLAV